MKYCLSPQEILHHIPLLSSQYSYSVVKCDDSVHFGYLVRTRPITYDMNRMVGGGSLITSRETQLKRAKSDIVDEINIFDGLNNRLSFEQVERRQIILQ